MLYGFCVFKETNKASYTNLKKKKKVTFYSMTVCLYLKLHNYKRVLLLELLKHEKILSK